MSHDYYITPEEYEVADKNGISRDTLHARMYDLGWRKQKALHTPPQTRTRVEDKWIQMAIQNGIKRGTFFCRIRKQGWSPEKAATEPLLNRTEAALLLTENKRVIPREILELAAQNGIKRCTFYRRLRYGWDYVKAATHPIVTPEEAGRKGYQAALRSYGDFNVLIFKNWRRKSLAASTQ